MHLRSETNACILLAVICASAAGVTPPPRAVSFYAARSYASGGSSAVAADFNGDGRADLVVVNQCAAGNCANGLVSILLGNGDGTFQEAVNYSFGQAPSAVAVADFNGDGKADLVVVNQSNGSVSILLGNGDGTFQQAVNYGVGEYPLAVAVGDFNGDGKADLVVANSRSNNVSVLLGNGDGSFQAPVNYAVGNSPISVVVGDFNRDGKPDLAVANGTSNNVSVLLGNGDGSFRAPVNYEAGWYPSSIAVGDFNGDGNLDLAVADANGGGNNLSVLLGNGDGTFRSSVKYAAGTFPSSVAVADFNGDGKPDLAVQSDGMHVLLGNGDGTFRLAIRFADGGASGTVAVGDFNGDGKADLGVATAHGVSVLLGNGNGTFPAPVNYPVGAVGAWPTSLALGDFNHDGNPDVVVVNDCISNTNCSNGTVSILLGNGNGLSPATAARTYAVGNQPSVVAVADFNGDGKADLVVVNQCVTTGNCANGSVSILLGNGDGSLQAAINYVIGPSPWRIVVGDFNGDGKPDLALSNHNVDGTISVMLGNGDGSFQAAVNYPAGSFPESIAGGDFNGDGKYDLVVTNHYGNVSVLLGNGDGSFQAPVNYAVGYLPLAVVVGDFNGDGKPDLAVSSWCLSSSSCGEGIVSILLGNGDGTFQQAVNYGVGGRPSSIAVADFNGDDRPDLAVVNGNISILLGNGDGSFQAAVNYAADFSPAFVAVGDFYHHGKLDLAVVNGSPRGEISILTNTTPAYKTSNTALVSSLNPSYVTQFVTFTATIAGQDGAQPNGWVTFKDGTKAMQTLALSGGHASYSTMYTASGKHTLTAVFSGDINYLGSTSPALSQLVKRVSTSTALSSSQNPSNAGQSVTFTATVSSGDTSLGLPAPSGTVIFKDGATKIGTGTLTDGAATFTTKLLSSGTHAISAQYGGNTDYLGSASSKLSQVVN